MGRKEPGLRNQRDRWRKTGIYGLTDVVVRRITTRAYAMGMILKGFGRRRGVRKSDQGNLKRHLGGGEHVLITVWDMAPTGSSSTQNPALHRTQIIS